MAGTFDEVIQQGRLMRDPSLLVTNPTRTDPSLAPAGRQTYYVLAPVPNLNAGGPTRSAWREAASAERYADELIATLERRGYVGLRRRRRGRRRSSPRPTGRPQGHAAGTPFAAAHTFGQTGPFRPGNLHPTLSNVVFVGSGTQPGVGVPMVLISGKLAAATGDGVTPMSVAREAAPGRAGRRRRRGRRLGHRGRGAHRARASCTGPSRCCSSTRTGRTLLQQRAAAKTRFPLRWANACCGHPAPGEAVTVAAARRLGEELGVTASR